MEHVKFSSKKILLCMFCIVVCYANVGAQSLTTGGIGSFESATNFTSEWFIAEEGYANITIKEVGTFYGNSHLRVNVNTENPENVRIHNREESYFNLVENQKYTVSFYAKGHIGNYFTVSLVDENTTIKTDSVQMKLDEWTFYTMSFTSTVTSTKGRIRLNFLETGIYEIDELIVKEGDFNIWHVSPSGIDSVGGDHGLSVEKPLQSIKYAINDAWSPGDLIYVMNGTYHNNGFETGSKDNGSAVFIGITGTLNGPLAIRNYPGHTPKIEFDGSGGFIASVAEYLEISGFEIKGPNAKITKEEAEANRLNDYKYYKGRGIAIWASAGGHHISLHSNKVYDCPSSGIRINNSDYCILTNNEVSNTTTWSSAAESAIVIAQSKSYDQSMKIKMRLTRNKVFNNVNNIHYFNGTYDCTNSKDYGCEDYPNIIDGSGCYITRNNDRGSGAVNENPHGQYVGMFLFANNVASGNGINGVVVHKSDNTIVVNNTTYNNGQVPLSEGRQTAGGITVNLSNNVRFYNNIAVTERAEDYGYKKYNTTNNVSGANNILVNGKSDIPNMVNTMQIDPQFMNEEDLEFDLRSSSPAIDIGLLKSEFSPLTGSVVSEYLPWHDHDGNPRVIGARVDIGAYEFQGSGGGNPSIPTVTKINAVNGASAVSPGETITVNVDYDASGDRDVVVIFQRDNSPYTSYKTHRETVAAGTGTINAILELPTDLPIANNDYQYKVFIGPVGGVYSDAYDNRNITNIDVVGSSSGRLNLKNELLGKFNVYPNPSKDVINFGYKLENEGSVSLKIYDINARLVAEYMEETIEKGEQNIKIDLGSHLQNGLYNYVFIIEGKESKVESGRFLIKK